ncbi:glutamine synthetase-like [Diorhabda sublineata]|uniref:glutamine synthetase-like n=1 Tax=Diorhabda sublineata TaxID=1163346 RepID=UPI0024E079DF|nr:glutamine synthetase-like [Diorhabda sublineata]
MFKIFTKLNRGIFFNEARSWKKVHTRAVPVVLEELNAAEIALEELKNKHIFERYMSLPIPESKVPATYIWIDGTGENVRCQSKTLEINPSSHKEIPNCTFNGSETQQANINNPDCYIVPVAVYNDPIKRGNSKLVLCEAFNAEEKPCKTNHRQRCVEVLNRACEHEIEVSFEQEYLLTDKSGIPFASQSIGDDLPAELHYAGIGAGKVLGREIAECLYRSCLYAGIEITGDRAEKVFGQWEFKLGPSPTIKAADDLWAARYLLSRIAEDYGIGISLDPKFSQQYPGSALTATFSTKFMRNDNGIKHIIEAFKKLEKRHFEHMKVYDAKGGADNKKRLTGKFRTSSAEKFTCGVADRTLSVRMTKLVNLRRNGFLEDRRPAANADPYQVISALVATCLLEM